MPYVPKNRIQTNLYTEGKEFYIKKTNSNYIGYYYKLYTGAYFTGKNPDDFPNLELVKKIPPTLPSKNKISYSIDPKNNAYTNLKEVNTSQTIFLPQLFYTQPTKDNYKLGEFQRFFCKKRNEFIYLEISKSDYDKLSQQDTTIDFQNWNPFQIPWTLTGDKNEVYNINRNIVLLKEKNEKLYGFGKYLREDYLRYYKS